MLTLLKDHLRVVLIIAGLTLFLPLGACEKAEPPRSNGSTCAANTQCSSALCHFQTCVVPEADDDLDGLVNSVEVIAGTDPLKADTDGDGQGDYQEVGSEFLKELEAIFALDQDKDGTIDALESFLCDTDCDGYSDQNDIRIDTTGQDNNVPMTAIHRPDGCVPICEVEDPPAIDDDEDGVPNEEDNCVNDANADQADGDEDGVGDVCDPDKDEDGVPDDQDNCPNIPNPDQADEDQDGVGDECAPPTTPDPEPDQDEDGVPDEEDNCPDTANPDQADEDQDGVGDACAPAPDTDEDGVPDDEDNCPETPNPDQEDEDQDGVGDACAPAPDADEDGVPDDEDNCPDIANPDQEDEDEDGAGDACAPELDTDEDGIPDDADNCPDTPNPDQEDEDEDGIGDACGEGCGETEILIDMSFDDDALGQPSGDWSHAGSSEITSGLEVAEGGAKDTPQCLQLPGDKVSHPDLYGVASSDLRFWFRWDTGIDDGEGAGTAPPDFTSQFLVRAQQAGAQVTLWKLILQSSGEDSAVSFKNEDDKQETVLIQDASGQPVGLSLGDWHEVWMRRVDGGTLKVWIDGEPMELGDATNPPEGLVDITLQSTHFSTTRIDEIWFAVGDVDCDDEPPVIDLEFP